MATEPRLIMAALHTDRAALYYAGDWSHPEWLQDVESRYGELLSTLRATLCESRLRIEPPVMLSKQLPLLKPSCLLLFGELASYRWLSVYLPCVIVKDLNNLRLVQAAGHMADIARRGWLSLEDGPRGLSFRRNMPD